MTKNTLDGTMASISAMWGRLTTELVQASQRHLEALANVSPEEPWLAELLRDQPASRKLYRDPLHGFVLLAHFETPGLYRPPHDHGPAWVVYAVHQGASEMGTYGRIDNGDGSIRLVKRNSTLVEPGQAQVYLPGDIHDTRCVSGPALLFRFTERDLKREYLVEHKVSRYADGGGYWAEATQ
jgi:hypothetical protein